MDIRIPTMKSKQIGGDMDPGTYGGTVAKADGDAIELLEIQPVRECIGEKEAVEVGYPFWSNEGYYTLGDLDIANKDVQNACDYADLSLANLDSMSPTERAVAIALACFEYGLGSDPGPCGWASDIVTERVRWWGGERSQGWRYLSDEDAEFRRLLRENS